MKFAVVVFPGATATRTRFTPPPMSSASAPSTSGTRTPPPGRRRRDPAGRLRARRLPAHRRHGALLADHARRRDIRRRRRPGAGHLQRLPDPARGRTAARRDAAQPRPEVPLRARPHPRRADRHAVHARPAARAASFGFPIAHGEGNYFAEPETIARLEANRQIVFRYTDAAGRVDDAANPNGSAAAIAGLCNEARNVVGLMPHPERACELALGSVDGLQIFESAVAIAATRVRALQTGMIDAQRPRTPRPQARRVRPHRAFLGREPNLTELGIFSVMWSEHCSYKSSRVHLQDAADRRAAGAAGPGENAGAVDIGDGLAAVFKIESHNHPSFIEPYQGAATGVGGIIRDIFTMGARPIALLNSLRFGALDRAGHAASHGRRRRRDRRLRQQHRHSDGRRRNRVRAALRRQSAGQRVLPRRRPGVGHHQGRRLGRRQQRLLRRRQNRPRRDPRRDDGVGGVRRAFGGEAAGRPGRRSVHGEAAARGLPRGDADRHAHRHPGHGRRRL